MIAYQRREECFEWEPEEETTEEELKDMSTSLLIVFGIMIAVITSAVIAIVF